MIEALKQSFQTNRLICQPLEACDKHQEFMHGHFSSPVSSGLGNPNVLRPISRKDSDARLEGILKNSLIAVILILRHDDTHRKDSSPPPEQPLVGYLTVNKSHSDGIISFRSASISLTIAEKHQGNGFGREAVTWALNWGFGYASLHRMEISTISFNERALALYRSIGFVEEGRLRKTSWFNHQWYDRVLMSMLDEEYAILRKDD